MKRGTSVSDARDEWDDYWSDNDGAQRVYGRIALFYRNRIIRPTLTHWMTRTFPDGGRLLHAGCGSGGVDVDLHRFASVTALDFSAKGIRSYAAIHPGFVGLTQGDVFVLPFRDRSFDGVFNLGVMEHFTEGEIQTALCEMHRVLRPGGHVVLFWPPEWGLSVNALRAVRAAFKLILRRDVQFHPDEINRIRSRRQCRRWLEQSGFSLERFAFGPRDLFTHQIVVARRVALEPS